MLSRALSIQTEPDVKRAVRSTTIKQLILGRDDLMYQSSDLDTH